MRFLFCLLIGLLLQSPEIQAQSGCTDPCANNHDAAAVTDDGSCSYTLTTLSNLPASLSEISGMVFTDNELWVLGDGGSGNVIHRIDTSTWAIVQTVTITNASNSGSGGVGVIEDWEDIAASATHLFIADIGNNNGHRENLKVYRIAKSAIGGGAAVSVTADTIALSYADQGPPPFVAANRNNDYDAEALIYFNGALHIFTKNWVSLNTRHYVLPATPGTYSISPLATYATNSCLITGADVAPNNAVVLIGNNTNPLNARVVGFYLDAFPTNNFFGGNTHNMDLGASLSLGQVESIAFASQTRLFSSTEAISLAFPPINITQRAYGFHTCLAVTLDLGNQLALSVDHFGDRVILTWENNESNETDYFQVERSFDREAIEVLVKAEGQESYRDYEIRGRDAWYRVLQFMKNGSMLSSDWEHASLSEKESWQISTYPNPVSDFINISSNQEGKARILDPAGRILKEFDVNPYDSMELNLKGLPKGIYVLIINNLGGKNFHSLMIKN